MLKTAAFGQRSRCPVLITAGILAMQAITHSWLIHMLFLGLNLILAPHLVSPASPEQWRSRVIYQVVTDRFARADCWGEPCDDLNHYCGGTFAGLQKMSGYIQEMGFDAVWWSPVTLQGNDALGSSGYHGYWPSDLYKINPAFGTQEDLQALVKHYQDQGMYVLFDMVINHMGYGDVSSFYPFNSSADFHDCSGCLGPYCDADPAWLSGSPGGAWSNEHCKIAGLPDLNHSDPTVVNRLISWFNYTQHTYNPDGFRLDAAGHSLLDFCVALNQAVEPFTVGELFLGDTNNTSLDVMANFMHKGGADGAFAFPLLSALVKVFQGHDTNDLIWLAEVRTRWLKKLGPKVHDMLLFADNHDVPRWLHANHTSVNRFKNALTYVLFMEGIPVIYYGTEQGFTDPHPFRPDPRAPLWTSQYQHEHPLWLFLKTAITYRKQAAIWDAGTAVQHYADAHYLVLSRGAFVIVLTNVGEDGPAAENATVHMVHDLPERFWGRSLQNIFNPEDMLVVSPSGVGLYKPDPVGKPQVFYQGQVGDPLSFYTPGPKVYDSSSTAVFITFVIVLALLLLVLTAMHLWAPKHQSETLQHCCCYDMVAKKGAAGSGATTYRHRSRSFSSSILPSDVGTLHTIPAEKQLLAGSRSGGSLSLRFNCKPSSAIMADTEGAAALQARQSPAGSIAMMADSWEGPDKDSQPSTACTPEQQAENTTLFGKCKSATTGSAYTASNSTSAPSTASTSSAGGSFISPFASREIQMAIVPSCNSTSYSSATSSSSSHNSSAAAAGPATKAVSNEHGTLAKKAIKSSSAGPSASILGRFKSASGAGKHVDMESRADSTITPDCGGSTGQRGPLTDVDSITSPVSICHVALEYSIPSLGYTNQLMYGGMGLVVDTFIKDWPGPMGLIAPLYEPCYSPPPAWMTAGNTSTTTMAVVFDEANPSAGGNTDHPSFLPAGQKPLVSLTVHGLDGQLLPVQVFKYETQENGHPRVYYLIQSDVFRHRDRPHMYTFSSEDEMLTWLAVLNKAVAAVVTAEGITHLQQHEYHAGLSLLFMPEHLRPAVMYVAHNAHYNAKFPVPTQERRQKVYAALNFNSKLSAPLVEHNGNVDVLRSVVTYMRQQQEGKGVVAVSPRYAEQVCDKLSVFWQLSNVGRPTTITGILNSLDMSDSLAASGLSLSQILTVKGTAKLKLQRQYGLATGQQYTLMTFVGRMTQQKGCDIIADAATDIMAKHPEVQMVVVGPTGDPVGAAAISNLHELSQQYPDRMYCPIDHYVAGAEKEMLLQATDFCLLPSRFEPCGLTDVEFGWNGAIVIGHDTGGLGKMPGVYFTAQASHLSHLSHKLKTVVCKALALSITDRHGLVAEALARRFPVDAMMSKYQQAWLQIDSSYHQAKAAAHSKQLRHSNHHNFFAQHWERSNRSTAGGSSSRQASVRTSSGNTPVSTASVSSAWAAAGLGVKRSSGTSGSWSDLLRSFHLSSSATATAVDGSSTAAIAAAQGQGAQQGKASSSLATPMRSRSVYQGLLRTASDATAAGLCRTAGSPAAASSAAGSATPPAVASAAFVPCCVSTCCLSGGASRDCSAAMGRPPKWLQADRKTFQISTYLLVVLQYFAMGPGMLLLTFLLLNAVAVKFSGNRCGLHMAKDWLMPVSADALTTSIIAFFAISTGLTPVWFWLAAKIRPVLYIRLSAVLVFVSYSLAFLALYTHQIFSLVLGFAAGVNMVASPLLSQGLLGEDDVDVFKVGRVFLALSESVRYSLLCTCMAMAAAAAGPVPHQVLTGLCMLASTVMMVWFCLPNSLPKAYEHMCFSFKGQLRMVVHISCFWLSLVCSTCDSLLLLINGFLVVASTRSLATLACYQAVAFGACGVAVLWNCKLLCSRAAELRLNAAVMMLAAMPFYMLLKAVVVMLGTSTVVLLVSSGAIDLVMGGRSSILGLAGFVTLPSREVVCIWQFAAILLGSAGTLLLVGGGYSAYVAGYTPSHWLLVGVIGGLELLRLVCVMVMANIYPRENLSAP